METIEINGVKYAKIEKESHDQKNYLNGKLLPLVHITYEGTCLPNDVTREEIDTVEQSQGSWNIGRSCAKKLFGKDIDKYTT